MLGPRAGTTLVGLLTVAPEVFDEVAEVRIPSEVHERLGDWRARLAWPSTTRSTSSTPTASRVTTSRPRSHTSMTGASFRAV